MRRALYDIAALVARLVVGIIFVAHGAQKAANGMGQVGASFTRLGVPMPELAGGVTMIVELCAGALLILGLLTPLTGLLLAAVCAGAAFFVHAENGIFIQSGGFELVGGLGAASLLLAAGGAGRFGLDHMFFGRRRDRARREAAEAKARGAWYGSRGEGVAPSAPAGTDEPTLPEIPSQGGPAGVESPAQGRPGTPEGFGSRPHPPGTGETGRD